MLQGLIDASGPKSHSEAKRKDFSVMGQIWKLMMGKAELGPVSSVVSGGNGSVSMMSELALF